MSPSQNRQAKMIAATPDRPTCRSTGSPWCRRRLESATKTAADQPEHRTRQDSGASLAIERERARRRKRPGATNINKSCGDGSMKAIALGQDGDEQDDIQQPLRQRCGAASVQSRRAPSAGLATASSIGAFAARISANGVRGEDVEVEQDRPVLDVVEIVLDAVLDLFLGCRSRRASR